MKAVFLALAAATLVWAPAHATEARRLGTNGVLYEVRGPAWLVGSSTAGAVVIDVAGRAGNRRPVPSAPFKLRCDPRALLLQALSKPLHVETQARLEEDYFRRLGVIVPAAFSEQALFGKTVPHGQERTGDVLFYAGPNVRTPARSCLFLAPDRLVYYSSPTGKIQHASVRRPPWGGKWLYSRRILGTVFERYLRHAQHSAARPRGPKSAGPDFLPEHFDTELEGIASLYGDGDGSHGHATANGETYDEEALTCAHRTLPFNTWVQVTNVENGRHVIVRVNDRGPFAQKERVVDLSYRAARLLGMDRKGTARVKLSVIRVAHENDV